MGFWRNSHKYCPGCDRTAGKTKYNWRRVVKGLIDMVSVWFWNKYAVRPLHLLGGLGMVFIFFGFISSLYTAALYMMQGDVSHTTWPILSVFLVLMGIQLFISGLLADVMAKTYFSTTRDTPYDVRVVVEREHPALAEAPRVPALPAAETEPDSAQPE